MTRFLILLTLVIWCIGCATAPPSTPPPPSSSPPGSSATSAQQEDAADVAAQREVDALTPNAPKQEGGGPGGGRRPAMRPKEQLGLTEEVQLQTEVGNWFNGLLQGNIQYKIPSTMLWKEASTASVVIQGAQAPASSGLQGATGTGQLKVSNRMKVVVSSPDNPDEFTITPEEGTSEIQFVPENGSSTWNWSVTPKYTGSSQRLQISAWVLYPGQDDKILLQLPVYTANVGVHVPGIGECLKRLLEGDPDYWLKYGLPGGGGFVFVGGAFTWLFRRKSTRKKKRP